MEPGKALKIPVGFIEHKTVLNNLPVNRAYHLNMMKKKYTFILMLKNHLTKVNNYSILRKGTLTKVRVE